MTWRHILIDFGFRRNDENFDFVHTPWGVELQGNLYF